MGSIQQQESPAEVTNGGYKLGAFCIDEPRRMKVVIIGAGFSGILAGIRFRQRVRNLNMVIYDANAGVGGTWYSNRYPGLACDIPAPCYQYTFEEKTDWSKFYANGPEIRQYLEHVVAKYKLNPHIKLGHRIQKAEYNSATGKWHLTVRRPSAGTSGDHEEFTDVADIVFSGIGLLSGWKWPDIRGLSTFRGDVIHSADWRTGEGGSTHWEKTVETWKDKRVAVIGVGSSAMQIVPALQPRVKELVNYVRGKTWVSPPFIQEKMCELAGGEVSNYEFTEEDKKKFAENPEYFKAFRIDLEHELNSAYIFTIANSAPSLDARTRFEANMRKKLAKKPWIADHIIPDFAVGCRRLTPAPGFLEALCADNVAFEVSPIARVTPSGIDTVSGSHRALDVIVCATGYDTTLQLNFPVIGRNGVALKDKHHPHPKTYLGIATDGFPNWFQSFGPNSGVGAGSLLVLIEKEVDYAVAATLKMQRERLKSMEAKSEAVADFDKYLEAYFPKTVYDDKCKSWYKSGKAGGRNTALWPGSCLHLVKTLTHPRWEDYNYEMLDESQNRFYWLGDGNTLADKDASLGRAWYLQESEIDYPPVPPA